MRCISSHLVLRSVEAASASPASTVASLIITKPPLFTGGRIVGRLTGTSSTSTSTSFSERWWTGASSAIHSAARSVSTTSASSFYSGSRASAAATASGEGTADTAGASGGDGDGAGVARVPDVEQTLITPEDVAVASQRECADVLRIFKVVRAIRNRGHFAARLDPLGRSLG